MSTDNGQKRSSPFGRLGLDLLFFVALFVAFMVVVYLRALGAGDEVATATMARQLVAAASGALTLWVLACLWRVGSILRRRRLASEHPRSVILDTGRSKWLVELLPRLAEFRSSADRIPVGMSLSGDENVIALWGGWTNIRRVITVPWASVQEVTFIEVAELGRRSRGLNVVVRTASGSINLSVGDHRKGVGWSLSSNRSHAAHNGRDPRSDARGERR